MRLRTRFIDALTLRLAHCLPEAMASVWGDVAPVAAIEQLTFKSTGGIDRELADDFALIANFSGFLRLELRGNSIDELVMEPLISDVITGDVFLQFEDVEPLALTEKARFLLVELRDMVRDTQVVSSIRFSVEGVIARRVGRIERPSILAARMPNVGADHLGDYRPLPEALE